MGDRIESRRSDMEARITSAVRPHFQRSRAERRIQMVGIRMLWRTEAAAPLCARVGTSDSNSNWNSNSPNGGLKIWIKWNNNGEAQLLWERVATPLQWSTMDLDTREKRGASSSANSPRSDIHYRCH